MSSPQFTPRRRRPPARVLLARWIAVITSLVLTFYIVGAGISFIGNLISPAEAQPVPSQSSTKKSKPTQDATTKCPEGNVLVEVEISETTFAKGADTSISTFITSIGTSKCFRDVGATANEVFVQDLNAKVLWSSDKCQKKPKQNLVTLSPGDVYKVSFSWYGSKNPKVCGGEVADLNRGTYELYARNGDVISEPVTLTVE